MVARKFIVHHNDSQFDVDHDTDDGFEALKLQLFSLTSIPPDEQKVVGEDNIIINDDSDLNSVTNALRLVSISEEGPEELLINQSVNEDAAALAISDEELSDEELSVEELAPMLQALLHPAGEGREQFEELMALLQQLRPSESESREQFEERLRPYIKQVLMYEDPVRQEVARKSVPVEELEEKALVFLAKEGYFEPSKVEYDHAFLLQLLFWFKQSFSWVNAPPCDFCHGETKKCGWGDALPSEIQFECSQVELYSCNSCSRISRFPRYNDPSKLVETRRGRCGEWANCFTLYCRAFGYEARLILDFTDHVWTECFSSLLRRWMHLDPCEGVYDNPLLYEKGWNKKLNYTIAFSKDGVHDVTRRYTRKWDEVLSRRNITTEPVVSSVLTDLTKECRKSVTSQELSVLEARDKNEEETLEGDLHSHADASISLPGRQSGAKERRKERSELGSDFLSCSSCPIRLCVDKHVTKIYNSFLPLFSQFVKNGLSKSRVVEILGIIRGFLLDLRSKSFRIRSASINSGSDASQMFDHQIKPSMDELLAALSLKCEIQPDGMVNICLSGDPVETSIALPVALDAIADLIDNLHNIDNLCIKSLSLPLLKLNRLCSASVLASDEELPFGIVTSAFDGIRMSKWEEPNGAKGCWIIYKLPDGQKCDLEAYELMSANDAPERDPVDWVVERSDDGGSSWHILDERTSQIFEKRFQRKAFKIEKKGCASNSFRFKFLAVRDVQAMSRLQIGSIDLYAKTS